MLHSGKAEIKYRVCRVSLGWVWLPKLWAKMALISPER